MGGINNKTRLMEMSCSEYYDYYSSQGSESRRKK